MITGELTDRTYRLGTTCKHDIRVTLTEKVLKLTGIV